MNLKTVAFTLVGFGAGAFLMNAAKDNNFKIRQKAATVKCATDLNVNAKEFESLKMRGAVKKAYFLGQQAVRDSLAKAAKTAKL